MATGKNKYSVLVAGSSDKLCDMVGSLLPKASFDSPRFSDSAALVRRIMLENPPDIVIINAPLRDEFGTQLALDLADGNVSVLMLVPEQAADQVSYKVEDFGVMTLARPVSRDSFLSALRLLTAVRGKILHLEKKVKSLEEKMNDLRTVNRAKWILMESVRMSESDAHYFIEKRAMDLRISRREAAEKIIAQYGMKAGGSI